LAAAAVLFISTLAASATTFTFTITSNGTSGSGTLTGNVDPLNSSAFDITSGTGVYGSSTLSLVTPSGNTTTYFNYPSGNPNGWSCNNVLYTTGNPVDLYGLLFYLDGGSDVFNIFYNGGLVTSSGSLTAFTPNYPATFTIAEVFTTPQVVTPEPSTIALLSTGLLSIAAVRKRRFA